MEVLTVPGKDAPAELERLRQQYSATGLYPILLGDAGLPDALPGADEVAEIIQQSKTIEIPAWLAEKPEPDHDLYEGAKDEWPRGSTSLTTHLDILTNRPLPTVNIALLKVAAPWEAFAVLNFGGWNDCPEPAEHCAIHRFWENRFGAQVVSITSDVVQCVVARPPSTREASLDLAREQYGYAYDIVEQGTETIPGLAAGLINSRYWYFWWD